MSPFRQKGTQTYKARFHDEAGKRYIRTLGTALEDEAVLIEAWGRALRIRRDWRTLGAIINERVRADVAYWAAQEGRLDALLTSLDAKAAQSAEVDVDELVKKWAPKAKSATYVRQVRSMIVEGTRFPLSQFTRRAIAEHFDTLKVAGPTLNRYRAAFSRFCVWLVEREYLDRNIVREISGYGERDPRMVHYDRETAQKVIAALPHPYNVLEAFMAGGGMEVSTVLSLTRGDIDMAKRDVQARGTKNRWRNRTVRITEDWCWHIIAPYLVYAKADARLFDGITQTMALGQHRKAVKAVGAQKSTLHDWRHTYAIQALKDGYLPQTIKRQLGHSPHSTILERVYASWLPKSDADYEPQRQGSPRKESQ